MTTIRHIEKAWVARRYGKLLAELVAARPEGQFGLGEATGQALPAAAMGVVRLDELAQTHVPLYTRLVRAILAAQEADGGWGDPAVSALCLRALLCGGGQGVAVERGMQYLASLQKAEGIWPGVPLRRMPADPHASAVILHQLGDAPAFRSAVRFGDAVAWFEHNRDRLDSDTRRLWDLAAGRCGRSVPAQRNLTRLELVMS
jgi:hypothetical protein